MNCVHILQHHPQAQRNRKSLSILSKGGNPMFRTSKIAAAGVILCVGATVAMAQNPPAPDRAPIPRTQISTTASGQVTAATAFPTSKLKGLNVRNAKGETIGAVDDLVISLTDGKVNYVAMSVGGVLGIGDKLFAIPFRELKFNHGKEDMHFVLDISKEKLDQAPGFDKNHWPDFADPQWRNKVDKYYHKSTDERTTRAPAETRKE
jgi:sporulation protein YlmC with PRC-barrel domain